MSDDSALTLRARRRLETETAIRDAALELFLEQGPQETTADQIAALAGVSTRTFFRYFDTKESAALPGLGWVQDRFEESAASIHGARDVIPVLNRLFLDAVTDLEETESIRTRKFFRLLSTDAVMREAAGARDAYLEQWLVQRLSELLPEEDGLELRLLVAAGVSQSRTVWAYWYELDQDEDSATVTLSQLFSRASQILARGIR